MKLKLARWQIQAGDACTISGKNIDTACDPFIDQRCTVVKHTKAGLIKIILDSDTRKTISIPLYDYIPLISLESVRLGKIGRSPSHYDDQFEQAGHTDLSKWKCEPTQDLKSLHGLDVEDDITQMLIGNINRK
jgi:hypothetical protein